MKGNKFELHLVLEPISQDRLFNTMTAKCLITGQVLEPISQDRLFNITAINQLKVGKS